MLISQVIRLDQSSSPFVKRFEKKKDTVSVKYLNLSILSAWNLFWIDCGWISSNHSDFILVFLLVYSC